MKRKPRFYARCIPDFSYKSVYDIPYNGLYIRGITTLFFDLDNTLIAYNQPALSERMTTFLTELQDFFQIVIISNSNKKRVSSAIGDAFPFVCSCKKPLKSGFKRALKIANTQAFHVAIIGDQLMTDIYGGWRIKAARKILIRPVKQSSDIKSTKFNRSIEKRVIAKIMKKQPTMASRFDNYLAS